jgi:protein-S-isoprenylcysteine O-methyltransferase Ste14
LIFAASCALYSYRIVVEEKVLLASIGEPYRVFMTTRKRLVPYVY